LGIVLTEDTKQYGFVINQLGAHLGRTIMTDEASLLFSTCAEDTTKTEYRNAIVEDNVLLKRSSSARIETFRRLGQLYSLDPSIKIFRAMRELWDYTSTGQNLLMLLCALARDPLLRSTVDLVVNASDGAILGAKDFERVVAENFPGRMQAKTLASTGRNLASSWTQSGHLQGEKGKSRQHVKPDATVVAYSLLLAYLSGNRGNALFDSTWLKLLDTSIHQLHNLAQQASKNGWLDYRHSGQVTEITFRHFMEQAYE
jgi:hypothetical protein